MDDFQARQLVETRELCQEFALVDLEGIDAAQVGWTYLHDVNMLAVGFLVQCHDHEEL